MKTGSQTVVQGRGRRYLPLFGILAVNLIPLAGILFWGWSASLVVFYYWLENWVIMGFNALKMRKVGASTGDIGFFIMHFGGFTAIHGVFVFVLFNVEAISPWTVLIALASFTASHALSYSENFIDKREYERTDPTAQMFKPYARVVIMHIVILAGGTWAQEYGTTLYAFMLLIGLKTLVDLGSYLLEHSGSYRGPRGAVAKKAFLEEVSRGWPKD